MSAKSISPISELEKYVREKRGEYGAKRVQRAADEIPNLEKLYEMDALKSAFTGDNAKAFRQNLNQFVAFHPTQIKSAIGNRGTYDRREEEINKADGGAVDVNPDYHKNLAKFMEGAHPEMFNADGTPRVFYHGSGADFKNFEPNRGPAGFLAFKPETANYFAEEPNSAAQESADWRQGEHRPVVYPVHSNVKKIFDLRKKSHRDLIGLNHKEDWNWEKLEEKHKDIAKHGFDSYYDFEGGYKTIPHPQGIAVFHPHQIKSAIGNNGDFDPTNPEIHKGSGGFLEPHAQHVPTSGVTGYEDGGSVETGINVRNDDVPYADHIVDGKKKYETRNSHSLKPYVGKRVAIVRTGQGPAAAIGEVTVGEPHIVDENGFRALQDQHLVPPGSQFDIKPGGQKYLYPMINPERYSKERSVGHGIVSRKVNKATGGAIIARTTGGEVESDIPPLEFNKHPDFIPANDPRRKKNLDEYTAGNHPDLFEPNGNPKVFYHNSNRDFGTFNPEINPREEIGTHFGTINQANTFGDLPGSESGKGRRTYIAHLNIKNPLRLIDRGGFGWSGVMQQLQEKNLIDSRTKKRIMTGNDDYEDDGKPWNGWPTQSHEKIRNELVNHIKSLGHDGIVYMNRYEGLPRHERQELEDRIGVIQKMPDDEVSHILPSAKDSYIIFDKNQAKAVYGNLGTYDRKKDEMWKAAGGIVQDPQKAIRKAMMIARQARDVGGRTTKPLEGPPTSYFEVAPGKTWDPAQQESWEQLHPQAKSAISNRMIEEFVPKWKKQTGIKGELSHGLGGFGGYTNPNFTFRPNNPADINASMNGLGELFRQDSMMGAHHEPFEGSFPSGLVRIRLPKNATNDHVHDIYTALNNAGLAEGHSTDLENRTMDILSGSNHDEALEAAHKMDKVLGGKYNLHAYPTNISFPSHGENYGRIQSPGSERSNASTSSANNPLQAEAEERLKNLLAEAHLQGGGHEKPVDFSSLDSISRIYGGKIKVPSRSIITPGSPEGTLGVKGAPGVNFMGKQPHEFTPAEWGHFGEEHGVPSLGPKDTAKWQAGLQKIKTLSGRDMTVPGGIDNPEPFSYYDLLHLKSQGINPNDLPPEVHQKIHNRMISAMQPAGRPSSTQIANQMMFGMISPNQPLTPNELALQRIMAKGPRDIETLASMIPHHYSEDIPSRDQLNHFSRAISSQLGLHAASRGGIGASGSANYADIAEFAQKMRDRPDFFTFDPTKIPGNSPSEKWSNHVARVINEVRGLSAKTGSLASVWQSPKDAAISAIDRHMATRFQDNVFDDPQQQQAWQQATLKAFNSGKKKSDRVDSFQQMLRTPGGRGHFVDAILAHVNNIPSAKTRIKRTGEYNPSIPEGLRNVNWVSKEPEQMSMIAGPYVRALEQNQREAEAAGQGLFSNQWMLWDRIRNRLEPHEILYPGLENLPRMSLEQMRKVRDDLSKSGYMAESGTVKPLPSASHAGYFASGGAIDKALAIAKKTGSK